MTQVNKAQVQAELTKIGLKKGDNLIVHSSLSSIGKVKGGADTIIDAILDIIGSDGNLVMPTFGSDGAVFNPKESNTNLGIIPIAMMKRKEAVRSKHPLASVAAIGPKAEWLIKDHEKTSVAHGKNTPYAKLSEINGKILLLGVDQDRNTFLHTIEETLQLPYLKPKKAKYLDEKGKTKTLISKYFPGPHRNFIGLQAWIEKQGLTQKGKVGNSVAQLIPMKPLFDKLVPELKEKPNLFISGNNNLPDAVWQNADLFRETFEKEAFTLCADSQYAGQYIEEITDNLKKFGIDNIVLSYINNTPWNRVHPKKRKWYLNGLKNNDIKAIAIRFPFFDSESNVDVIAEANVKTVILPSTTKYQDIIKAGLKNCDIYFENVMATGEQLTDIFEEMNKMDINVKLAFNPLNFVKTGQNPFLSTYLKTISKRHISALFINDGLATGERSQLENGLAEIKELISILRCKSFPGLFILQGKNYKSFKETAIKFCDILKELGEAQ